MASKKAWTSSSADLVTAVRSEDRLLLAREEETVAGAVLAAEPAGAGSAAEVPSEQLRLAVAEELRLRVERRVAHAEDTGAARRCHPERAPVDVAVPRLVARLRVLGYKARVAADRLCVADAGDVVRWGLEPERAGGGQDGEQGGHLPSLPSQDQRRQL